ncbi:hypothetical protein [Microbacterium sp. EST19A]|uniref:hypothetical protein n=1 Tax=Microbacterium sp. EST19A TaxID=2862681 RepID=UPI001CBD8B9D|nr:hypothetical protein [Microbacterium sp. EST19A]
MGLFDQRKEEENQWAGLPSEPLDRSAADLLDTAPPVDPMALGLGVDVNSIVFPVAAPAPDAVTIADREPEDEPGD